MSDEQRLEDLRARNWESIATRVLAASLVHAARYGWRADSILPGGKSVEDLVIDAVEGLWSKPSRVNPDVDLAIQLIGIVRHKLWNLARGREGRTKHMPDVGGLAARPDCGIERFEARHDFERAMAFLLDHPKIRKQAEFELVLAAMGCGSFEVADIAADTGLTNARIYQLTRELRDVYPTIAAKLNGDGQAK